jgi:hypothetical protein
MPLVAATRVHTLQLQRLPTLMSTVAAKRTAPQ